MLPFGEAEGLITRQPTTHTTDTHIKMSGVKWASFLALLNLLAMLLLLFSFVIIRRLCTIWGYLLSRELTVFSPVAFCLHTGAGNSFFFCCFSLNVWIYPRAFCAVSYVRGLHAFIIICSVNHYEAYSLVCAPWGLSALGGPLHWCMLSLQTFLADHPDFDWCTVLVCHTITGPWSIPFLQHHPSTYAVTVFHWLYTCVCLYVCNTCFKIISNRRVCPN